MIFVKEVQNLIRTIKKRFFNKEILIKKNGFGIIID